MRALLSCPVGAIGAVARPGLAQDIRAAAAGLPSRIPDRSPDPAVANVFFCGYAARTSYGASSYLIVRPEGNVLVDSPRFAGPLVQRLEQMGGVRWMFLSHVDDVADHARFRAHFTCERIIHARELGSLTGRRAARGDGHSARPIEIIIEGDDATQLAPDLTIIPTPGHTRGHQTLLARDKYLFTGDHLWWSRTLGRLHASRNYCWHSWPEQLASLRRLLDYRFDWVLPGHGQRHHTPDAITMRAELEACLAALQQ